MYPECPDLLLIVGLPANDQKDDDVDPHQAAFRIRFEDLSSAEANRAAAELEVLLQRAAGGQAHTEIVKDRDDTQDFGATLLLVLGSEAVITIAKAIHNYVSKRGDRVVIETDEGTVVATGSGADGIDVAATVAAMRSHLT